MFNLLVIFYFLNDKNRRIKTLNLADCILVIYRRWFVDFEPFKNESFIDSDFGFISENWKVGSIVITVNLNQVLLLKVHGGKMSELSY